MTATSSKYTRAWLAWSATGLLLGVSIACGDSEEGPSGDAGSDHDGGDHPATTNDASTSDAASDADADAALEPAVDGLLIELDDGELMGEMAGDARRFLKIPYAKPPIGALRWRAPEPNDPWDGVRAETEFVAGCPQLADQGAPASDNEDCLYLNVWSPEPAPSAAPVMVWIHGGGNFSGAAGIPIPTSDQLWYDGRVFAAERGVVLVTINYRLGPLGFFAHPALAAEGEPVGNQGLQDQRMALQWVHDNIAKLGGDPGNVTIFGESAGSADVCYHMASPQSRGLFHRAIGQSGGCTIRSVGPEQEIDNIGANMEAYGVALGCPAGADQLDCMRDASVEDILSNSMQPMPGSGAVEMPEWSFQAVIDGEGGFLPDKLSALFDRGDIAQVPYLLGSNNDEGTTFVISATPLTSDAEYLADLELRYGDAAQDIAELYPPSDFDGDFNAARARVIGDSGVVCSTHDTARRAADAGLQVFMYNFNYPWAIAGGALRAGHAGEISHVFGTPFLPMEDAASEAVADGMNRFWASFAATGDPNGEDTPAEWPQFHSDDDKRLQLDTEWDVLEDFRTEECAFWRAYHNAE